MTDFALIPENEVFLANDGTPASGFQLFVYTAGSSTKATTYQESTGQTANTNPIILDSRGQTPYGVYVATGTYKTVLATDDDTDPPATPIRTRDAITPRNDATSAAQSEWVTSGMTPTYVSGTSFTVLGDQESALHVNRRLRIVDSGGTSYATISVSTYNGSTLTTVTVVNDVTAIDSGMSSFDYALLAANNPSVPANPGQWSFVEKRTVSGDGTIEVYHDGFDSGSAFVDGWQYRLEFDEVYSNVDSVNMSVYLYEGGFIRNATNEYSADFHRVDTTTITAATLTSTIGYLLPTLCGTSRAHGFTGYAELTGLGSTTKSSRWRAESNSIVTSGTARSHGRLFGYVYTNDLLLAADKLTLLTTQSSSAVGSMTAGEIRLYRKKES